MSILKRILIIFFLLFPISNIFVQNAYANFIGPGGNLDTSNYAIRSFDVSAQTTHARDISFNNDGTKMFIINNDTNKVFSYTLSTPYNISTAVFVNEFSVASQDGNAMNVQFNNDGSKMFIGGRANRKVFEYSLSTNFDISSASVTYNGNFIDVSTQVAAGSLFGLTFSPDGTMMFVNEKGPDIEHLHQYSLNKSFDLSGGANFIRSVELATQDAEGQSRGIAFNQNGTRLFMVGSQRNQINQYTLSEGFNISTATLDGGVNAKQFEDSGFLADPQGIDFSPSGLKMYVANLAQDGGAVPSMIIEYHLPCPFNLFAGKCSPIAENKDRTGIAMAQIEIAKRTIDQSTDTALNRLKWIRRNKDKQNLTNLNIDFNFNNQRLASLTEVVRTSAVKKKKKNKDEKRDVFYWSEGSVAIGRVGDTRISSTKEINTKRITVGADRFIDDKTLRGLAFSVGRNNVDVGNMGSNVDADTYNLTYYSTSPMKDDEKFVDKIFGIGKIHSDILTVLDGNELTANRRGKQIFGSIKIKDEIKKDNLIFIPSGRFDIGHTLLDDYEEVGVGGIIVEKQHVRTKNLRAALAMVEDISNDKYTIKRHGKIEYRADIDRSSDFKYKYKGDSGTLTDTLHVGALHNITGELGIDIVFPENYSIFIIYERDQAIDYGHTDNLHIALGYLPNKNTNFAIQLEGIDNTEANYIFSKNINDFLIDLKLTNHLMRPDDYEEASLNLRRKF